MRRDGRPSGPEKRNRGRYPFVCWHSIFSRHKARRVGKGGGTAYPFIKVSRAPCPRVTGPCSNAWARRTRGRSRGEVVLPPLPTLQDLRSVAHNRPDTVDGRTPAWNLRFPINKPPVNEPSEQQSKGGTRMLKRLLKASALGLPILVLSATAGLAQQQAADPTRNITPVTDAMLRNPPPGDWLMWRRTYNAWGYSPLEQINKGNVKNLKLAWTWSLTNGPTETT